MSENVAKINIGGDVYQMAGQGGGAAAVAQKVIFGKALKATSNKGSLYFFRTGFVEFNIKRQGDKYGHYKIFSRESGIALVGTLFKIPDDWADNEMIQSELNENADVNSGNVYVSGGLFEYLSKCVVTANSMLSLQTTSPYYAIECGQIVCNRSIFVPSVVRGQFDNVAGSLEGLIIFSNGHGAISMSMPRFVRLINSMKEICGERQYDFFRKYVHISHFHSEVSGHPPVIKATKWIGGLPRINDDSGNRPHCYKMAFVFRGTKKPNIIGREYILFTPQRKRAINNMGGEFKSVTVEKKCGSL